MLNTCKASAQINEATPGIIWSINACQRHAEEREERLPGATRRRAGFQRDSCVFLLTNAKTKRYTWETLRRVRFITARWLKQPTCLCLFLNATALINIRLTPPWDQTPLRAESSSPGPAPSSFLLFQSHLNLKHMHHFFRESCQLFTMVNNEVYYRIQSFIFMSVLAQSDCYLIGRSEMIWYGRWMRWSYQPLLSKLSPALLLYPPDLWRSLLSPPVSSEWSACAPKPGQNDKWRWKSNYANWLFYESS